MINQIIKVSKSSTRMSHQPKKFLKNLNEVSVKLKTNMMSVVVDNNIKGLLKII